MTMDEDNEMIAPQEEEEIVAEIPSDWAYPKIYQMTVELHDGTIIDGFAQKSPFGNEIYIYPSRTDYTYVEIASIFSDPEKTRTIQSHMSESETVVYSGYTLLGSITVDNFGKFTITLRKPY